MSPSPGTPLIGGIYPPPFKDFLSPKVRRAIFWGVLGIHFAVLVCPFLWSLLRTLRSSIFLKQ